MEFYYLDHNNKQVGPLSVDQLKSVGLKPDTLVFAEGFDEWKPAKDVEKLKSMVRETPSSTDHGKVEMNYERNKLYFFPKPEKKIGWQPWLLIGIGFMIFLSGQTSSHGEINALGWCAAVSIVVGVVWLFAIIVTNASRDIITDKEYDWVVYNKFKSINIMQTALEKIGIDEEQVKEIPPVSFHGYRIDKTAIEKIGADGKLRTSKYDATALFFSDKQVYIYQQIFDMLDGTKLEYTLEYFYRDVVSFSTSTKTPDRNNKNVKGVNTFQLIVPNDIFYCSIARISDADEIISAVKQKLREKKG